MSDSPEGAVQDWWRTGIIEMEPGVIRYRGYPVEELIGNVSFAQMVWLMLRGELPSAGQATLLDAVLMSAVDHGPQAPSIAIARMAVTCGIDLNNAMASAVNLLGGVHAGAGEQALELYLDAERQMSGGAELVDAVEGAINRSGARVGKYVPGFGHRFHPLDPRAPRLLQLVDSAAGNGVVSGGFAHIGREVERQLETAKGRRLPMNIDGASAVSYAELGFPPPLARGLFCISRSVGILAHAWEQSQQGGRNKGPVPKEYLWTYDGPEQRSVEGAGKGR